MSDEEDGIGYLGYKCQQTTVYVLIFGDVLINATLDSLDLKTISRFLIMGVAGVHVVIRLAIIGLIVAMLTNTFLFRHGLLPSLCSQFKAVPIIGFAAFIFVIISRIIIILNAVRQNDILAAWNSDFYNGIYWIHHIVSFLFYLMTIQTCYDVGRPEMYDLRTWMANARRNN